MPKLVILGSSNAIPSRDHDNTHMALRTDGRTVLIDCVSSPIVRLEAAGIALDSITDLILTHFHPDHVSGVPSFLMSSWLLGRKSALNIYGLEPTLERVKALMEAYGWKTWPRFYPVNFQSVPEAELTCVLDDADFRIDASPVRHMIPTLGLRVEFKASGRILAYSCDTEPDQAVVRLAAGADVLMHEATGAGLGHSSPAQAGEIARQAEAGSLVLIHYPTGRFSHEGWIEQAQTEYQGPVHLAHDFMEIEF
jgi:ribonuclease Z